MIVFWVVASCSLVGLPTFPEVLAASIIRAMGYTRLHGATTQKTAIFILAAVRTSNPEFLLLLLLLGRAYYST
jgi:hypothetical protein